MRITIRLWKSDVVKKANKKMWKHVLKNWIKFNFKHSPCHWYSIDSDDHLNGKITGVCCSCGEYFHREEDENI
jgi:hypothetical protein